MQRRQTLALSTLIAVVSTLFITGLSIVTFRQIADAPFISQSHSWSLNAGDGTLLMDGMITLSAQRIVFECTPVRVNYTCTINCRTGSPMNLTILGWTGWVDAADNVGGFYPVNAGDEYWTEPLDYSNVQAVEIRGTAEFDPCYSGAFPVPSIQGVIRLWFEGGFESSRYHWGGNIIGPGEFTPIIFARTLQHPATWIAVSMTIIWAVSLALVIYSHTLRSRKLTEATKRATRFSSQDPTGLPES